VDGDDVGVVEGRERVGLALEAEACVVTVELPLSERSDFLLSKIAGDDLLRQEVAALLAADRGGAALARYWPVASESLLAGLRTESQPTSDSGAQVSPGLISGSRVLVTT